MFQVDTLMQRLLWPPQARKRDKEKDWKRLVRPNWNRQAEF